MDVVLVGFIAGLTFSGWRFGFLRRVIGIGFMLISFVLSAWFRYPVGAIAKAFFPDIPADYANLVGYTIAFPVILGGLHLTSAFLLKEVSVRGITKELDQGLGALFGAVEAILIVSAVIVIMDTYFGTGSQLMSTADAGVLRPFAEALNASTTVHILRETATPVVLALLGPFLPTDIRTILPGGLPGLPGALPGLQGGGLPNLPLPTP